MNLPTIKDYEKPQKDFRLPDISSKILRLLNKRRKPVVLKKEIICKNKTNHPEILPEDFNAILRTGLYQAQEILQPNFSRKPNYFNFLAKMEKNNVVVIELAEEKADFEIVGFFRISDRKRNIMRRKTNRDGGQSIITG